MNPLQAMSKKFGRLASEARALNDRECERFRYEIARVPGLMTLLMKSRNGERWSVEDRRQLREQLRGLGTVGLYISLIAVPGTVITLPLLAWWLDRRCEERVRVASPNTADTTPTPPTR
jgi:hypothetical protein